MRPLSILLGVAAALMAGCSPAPPPTDRAMADAFAIHRASFEALRRELCLLKFDQTVMRDPDWAQPQMAEADEARIRGLLARLGAKGVRYVRGCQLFVEVWSSGRDPAAAHKKFRYGPPLYRIIEVKEPPVRDLNTYLDSRVRIASFEKKIGGGWWIELDHWQ